MTPFTRSLAITIALAALALGGCKSTSTVPITAATDEVAEYPELSLSQSSLRAALGFQQPIVTHVGNDLMQVTVPVRAKSNEDLHIEYRVVWKDAQGLPLKPETSWTPKRLEPRQPETIVVSATDASAVRFNMQFRWGKP